jgi:hypothetical protein
MDRAFTSSGNASTDPLASGSTSDLDTTHRVNRQAAWDSRTSPLRRSFGVLSTDGTLYPVDGDVDGMDGELDRNTFTSNLMAQESMGMTGIRTDLDDRGRERDGARGPGFPRREEDGMLDDAMGGYRPSSRGLGRGSSVNMDSTLPTYPGYIPTPPLPGPSQPTPTFMTATAPSSSRWYDNSDRHPPLPPLTLMNPLRRQSTDGYSQYPELAGSVSNPPSYSNQTSPQSPQTSGFTRTSGLFLPSSNQYAMSNTNYSGPPMGTSSYQSYQPTGRHQGDFYPRSAEPGPGPKSSSIRQNSGLSSSSRKTDGAGNRSKSHVMDGEDGTKRDENGIISVGPVGKDGWQLSVLQQPERARLCSFKEENETSEFEDLFRRHCPRLICTTGLTFFLLLALSSRSKTGRSSTCCQTRSSGLYGRVGLNAWTFTTAIELT